MSDSTDGSADVVRRLWARIAARDWAGLRALLGDDVVLEWPVTGERFAGADAVVAVNATYPEGWSIEVLTVVAQGRLVVSEVRVPHEHQPTSVAVSIWTVEDGRVVSGREYWTEPGSTPPPDWRRPG